MSVIFFSSIFIETIQCQFHSDRTSWSFLYILWACAHYTMTLTCTLNKTRQLDFRSYLYG